MTETEYRLEVKQVYEGGVEVVVDGIGPRGKQTERFVVPLIHIPDDTWVLVNQGRLSFTILAENVYKTATWQWETSDRPARICDETPEVKAKLDYLETLGCPIEIKVKDVPKDRFPISDLDLSTEEAIDLALSLLHQVIEQLRKEAT